MKDEELLRRNAGGDEQQALVTQKYLKAKEKMRKAKNLIQNVNRENEFYN